MIPCPQPPTRADGRRRFVREEELARVLAAAREDFLCVGKVARGQPTSLAGAENPNAAFNRGAYIFEDAFEGWRNATAQLEAHVQHLVQGSLSAAPNMASSSAAGALSTVTN